VRVLLSGQFEVLAAPKPGDHDVADHACKSDDEAADGGGERDRVHAFGW